MSEDDESFRTLKAPIIGHAPGFRPSPYCREDQARTNYHWLHFWAQIDMPRALPWRADFRAELLADPTAAFVKYGGVPAARLPRIVVHEEQPGSWQIVLPAKPTTTVELSDEELEKIAGGATPLSHSWQAHLRRALSPMSLVHAAAGGALRAIGRARTTRVRRPHYGRGC